MSTVGKPIECKAMVARAAKQPLSLETITVDPPKAGEVRVKVIANALCHTDIYTCKYNIFQISNHPPPLCIHSTQFL